MWPFLRLISDGERYLGNVDMSALYGQMKNYVERVIGPSRSDEYPEKYKVRVFADLIQRSEDDGCPGPDPAHDILAMTTYAEYAADSGDVDKARGWYLRMIASTHSLVPSCWTLYGAFCARMGDPDQAVTCMRKAVALDGRNRLALFVRVAVLMTADPTGLSDELRITAESLECARPRFSEAYVLFALLYRRLDMPDHAARSLATAVTLSADDADGVLTELSTTGDEPPAIDHGCNPILKCAVLLTRLRFAQLTVACLRCFAAQLLSTVYHYLMALSFHTLGEHETCARHLERMSLEHEWAERRTLLVAHNDFDVGRTRDAMARYFELCSRPTRARYVLAYSRKADYLAVHGRFAEAADEYYRVCTVIRTPTLMTKLGACLVALQQYPEAEKVLADAVVECGNENGRPWHHLAVLYTKIGQTYAANECSRQASALGFKFEELQQEFDRFGCHSAKCDCMLLLE